MPTYNERLIANNQKIDDITTLANTLPDADEINEKLDAQDIIIEDLKSALEDKAGKGGAKLNVFTQLDEPATKKGIWLKTDKEMEHFISDDNIFIGGTWAPASETASIPFQFYWSAATSVGTDIYILGSPSGGYSNTAYKYNTLTNTYTKLANIPYQFYYGAATSVGTDIYLIGGSGGYSTAYKYDTLTNTYTQLANMPHSFIRGSVVSIGTDIYIFGGNNSNTKATKYDTLTNTYTQLANIPYAFFDGSASAVGTSVYLLGSSNTTSNYQSNYKYDTLTNTYTKMTNTPYGLWNGSSTSVGTDIYILGSASDSGKTKNYKYNTLTDTYTRMTDIPYNFYKGSTTTVGTDIYLLGGESSKTTNRKFYAESKSYETDNTVVVAQGRTYNVGYNIELLSTELAEEDYQPLYGFADAWFYTIQDGLDGTIPTYYRKWNSMDKYKESSSRRK